MKERMRPVLAVLTALALCEGSALTIHRSFRSRAVGFGGGASVAVPLDAKASAAIDEARAKEAERVKVYIGRVTSVYNGNEICVVTDGGSRVPVRLDGIEAPTLDQPQGKAAVDFLRKLVHGRQVRVEYRKRDEKGWVLGKVTHGKMDVNQKLVAEGMAKLAK